MIDIVISPDAPSAAAHVAGILHEAIRQHPAAVIGVATGSTPSPVYRALATRLTPEDVRGVSAFALDEYVGLPREHPESYHSVVFREVTRPLGLDARRVRVPDGQASDLAAAAEEYENAIVTAGGVDIQLLGIGTNGHIGFNEPGSAVTSRTRAVRLAAQTRADNARFFDTPGEVPTHALTQGIGTILDARRIVLLALGPGKAHIVSRALHGPMTAELPATALRTHPACTVVLDRAAAAALPGRGWGRSA